MTNAPLRLTVGDLDGDGKSDVAVTQGLGTGNGRVAVWLNKSP